MALKVKIEGFEALLKDIEAAGGSINKACDSAIRQSAQIMKSELKGALERTDIDPDLAKRMPEPEITAEGNRFAAEVGWRGTSYDPNNPSDYFKAIFANYGTPNRKKHGKERARGFIQVAKKRAKPKIKKAQKEAFEKILQRLQRQ